MTFDALNCPLCGRTVDTVLFAKKEVQYYSCVECGLVFMDPAHLPSIDEERERYLQHNNDPEDDGYVTHLMDIGERVCSAVNADASGLDYGCGTAPVLACELEKRGLQCVSYDPLFANNTDLLRARYDFITCCEAIEHFHRPAVELIKLRNMLKDGGVIGFKTSLIEDGIDYQRWYYANDPSHVIFLRDKTIDWIASEYGLELLEREKGRFVFRKVPEPDPLMVAAGVISREGKLLVARRNSNQAQGGWEFPGGKLMPGEAHENALVREIEEEMGLSVSTSGVIAGLRFPHGGRWLELIFVRAAAMDDPSRLEAHSEWRWCEPKGVRDLSLMPGDRAFVDMFLSPA
jgi:mutator protein MutT